MRHGQCKWRKCLGIGILLAAMLAVSCAPRLKDRSSTEEFTSLRVLAQRHNIQIGTAVTATLLRNEPIYRRTLSREFNTVTPENAMKFGQLHPKPLQFDFRRADQIVESAQALNMQVRGHTLVWHHNLPRWLTGRSRTRDELIQILKDHITTVVGRYRGKIMAWDVVNEAVATDGSLRDTFWLKGIGPDYIAMAFEWAHEADPDALLFYNDYGGEGIGSKSDAIFELMETLLKNSVPIHGVGLQMHLELYNAPSAIDVSKNMARVSNLGLEVHITEIDVRMDGEATTRKLAMQAGVYRKMLDVCLSMENCTALVLWGFTDAHSWIPDFFEGWGSALIFDANYHPKPAYHALIDALSDRR